ncbi:MAG: hypothetical protein R2710_22955 [Acidimicrobiales bacterium]
MGATQTAKRAPANGAISSNVKAKAHDAVSSVSSVSDGIGRSSVAKRRISEDDERGVVVTARRHTVQIRKRGRGRGLRPTP